MSIIMVHGGVETSDAPQYVKVVQEAALAGFRGLNKSCLDAAEEAVKVLEASPLFNAGYGSVLNLDGLVEMDASIMDGATGRFGAVAAIRDVAHPVSVARRVLEDTPHVLLAGDGAIKFARSRGFPQVDCVTPEMFKSWQKAVELKSGGSMPEVSPFTGMPVEHRQPCDTVGCVVIQQGLAAAASSTGGSFLKLPGRVGDTPMIGGGILATGRCAVVCTGLGEAFMETLTAQYVDSLLARGIHPQEAAETALARLHEKKGAAGGLLVVDNRERYGAACNTRTFPVALLVDGKLVENFSPRKMPAPV